MVTEGTVPVPPPLPSPPLCDGSVLPDWGFIGSVEIIGFYYLTLLGATATFASDPAAGASPIMG